MLGGWTDWDEATEEVQNIANEVQEAVESEMGDSFEHFTANTYQSQVVNGWNYRIQIDVGRPHMLEILVYKHWSGTTELNESRYQTRKCLLQEMLAGENVSEIKTCFFLLRSCFYLQKHDIFQ